MKTKALISCAVTAQLICAFVFAYAKSGFLIKRLVLPHMLINAFVFQSLDGKVSLVSKSEFSSLSPSSVDPQTGLFLIWSETQIQVCQDEAYICCNNLNNNPPVLLE